MDENHVGLLKKVCAHRGEHISTFVRRSVLEALARLDYLTPEEAKALGIVVDEKAK